MGMKSGKKPDQGKGWTIEKIYGLFPRLRERDSFKAGYLSGGEQQILTIGRTLMGDPRLILLDEPTEGLAPLVVEAVAGVIREIHRSGVSVLLVEQSMEVVMDLADAVLIMNKGEIVFRGTPADLEAQPDVREQFLEL
jgi:branched-chain amino acid transport system ATP-binding protein